MKGDLVEIFLPYADYCYRISFFGDIIEEIETFDRQNGKRIGKIDNGAIFPANMYIAPKDQFNIIINEIQDDMHKQVDYFEQVGKVIEATRLKERVTFDIEMMKELGYCSGIENYSRYLDRRQPGERREAVQVVRVELVAQRHGELGSPVWLQANSVPYRGHS